MALPWVTQQTLTAMQSISADHPVYRVTISGNSYVVKAETGAGAEASSDIKWASKIMHNIVDGKNSQDTKVRVLHENEIDVIATKYTQFFNNGPQRVALEEALSSATSVWVMMHWQANLFVTSENMTTQQKQLLFDTINHGTFWKMLGKVIAVDLFTGNNDRFDFSYYETIPTGKEEQFWSNKGNVFINVSNVNRKTPMGLDFFFGQNAFGKDQIGDAAYIKAMKSKTEIDKIAGLIIASIMKELTGFNLGVKADKGSSRKSKATTKLRRHGSTAEKYHAYLTDSIWDNLQEIKRYLLIKHKEYGKRQPGIDFGRNLLRQAPTLPNHNPQRPGNTVPVDHNNKTVSKDAFPQNIEDRMVSLKWI